MKDETVKTLTDRIFNILVAKTELTVEPRNIETIHRIPGKAGFLKPVLVQMRNNQEKANIMKW